MMTTYGRKVDQNKKLATKTNPSVDSSLVFLLRGFVVSLCWEVGGKMIGEDFFGSVPPGCV